ncbi:hypothetical protein [Chryseobacterium arthrosphaerae]|uniref:hypothetical protein n=1 Tax=Chryseobacterium arthrosphaerae TaxID=651561 RepID=UPI00241EE9C0|nr:hypothetical protein [Chryseobacterium arthrosphaerae]
MKYTVGKYVFAPEKPFQSFEKAVQYIQDKYPELDEVTIEKFLTPKIKRYGNDQSGNITETDSVSQEDDTKNSTASPKRVKSNADKSG